MGIGTLSDQVTSEYMGMEEDVGKSERCERCESVKFVTNEWPKRALLEGDDLMS